MNCLYITLFFKIVAGIVQTFIKTWNQLLYPWVIEVCRLPFETRHDFLHLIIVVEHFPSEMILGEETSGNRWVTINSNIFFCEFPLDVHLLRWEIVWRNAPRIWRDFGSALPFQTRLKQSRFYHCQTSTAHMYRIKVDGSVAIINIKYFPIGLHVMYLYFPDRPRICVVWMHEYLCKH